MIQQKARVLWNRRISNDYYKLGLSCGGYETAAPGQFVMVQIQGQNAPLLRRPFFHSRTSGAGKFGGGHRDPL